MPRLISTNMSINNGDVERRYHDFSGLCLESRPDIIAVQEVSADVGQTALRSLAKTLGDGYRFYYSRTYPGQEDSQGIGVVTRLPVKNQLDKDQVFDSGHGRNKFQILDMRAEAARRLLLANVHMEAHLLLDISRRRKLQTLISHLDPQSPQVLVGDFNAIPHLPSIRSLSRRYRSAHSIVHGREPSHTYPTDLGEDLLLNNGDANNRQIFAMKLAAILFQKPENRRPSGLPRMVVDYAFVNHLIEVTKAGITGYDEADLTHSDHRGLEVDFVVN